MKLNSKFYNYFNYSWDEAFEWWSENVANALFLYEGIIDSNCLPRKTYEISDFHLETYQNDETYDYTYRLYANEGLKKFLMDHILYE